jgi:beta-lactamase regulating signal transducer with metallopeptidase domain
MASSQALTQILGFTLEPFAKKIGWVCLHSIWQAVIVASVLAICLRLIPRNTYAALNARYFIATFSLVALPVFSIGTYLSIDLEPLETRTVVEAVTVAPIAETLVPGVGVPEILERILSTVEPWLPWASLVWAIGVTIAAIRIAIGWIVMRRIIQRAGRSTDDTWQICIRKISQAIGVRTVVTVLISSDISSPVVFGWIKPVILWPAWALTGISPSMIDAIITHELAHVRRHDMVVNALQLCIDVLFFHHPAAWWISAQVRSEREHCADELAIAAMESAKIGTRVFYAQSLLTLEENRNLSAFAMAANGGKLIHRIRRIAGVDQTSPSTAKFAAAFLACFFLAAMLFTLLFFVDPVNAKNENQSGSTLSAIQQPNFDTNTVSEPIAQAILTRLTKAGVSPNVINSLREDLWLAIDAKRPWNLPQVHVRLGELGLDWQILHAPPMSLNTQSPAEQPSSGDSILVDEPIAKSIVARLAGIRVDSEILSATRDSMWEAIHAGEPLRLYQVHQLLEQLGIDPQRLHAPPGEREPQGESSATIFIKDGKKTR